MGQTGPHTEVIMDRIKRIIAKSLEVKQCILDDHDTLKTVNDVSNEIIKALKRGGKVLLCGNGGSAADAQHIAAELSGKFYMDRKPLFAEALHTNTSYVTAIANDYSFDDIFARLVEAKGRSGDVLIGITTSGKSTNVIKCIEKAREIDMVTVGLIGKNREVLNNKCSHLISVPSDDVPRIQEAHIMIGHIICEIVEDGLFGGGQ